MVIFKKIRYRHCLPNVNNPKSPQYAPNNRCYLMLKNKSIYQILQRPKNGNSQLKLCMTKNHFILKKKGFSKIIFKKI